MKIYDKEIYNKQESIKTTVIIIIAFLIGMVVGYFATSFGFVGTQSNNLESGKNNSVILNK